jgi:hypothetical protein
MAKPACKFFQGIGALLTLPLAFFRALVALSAKVNHKMAASTFLDRKPKLALNERSSPGAINRENERESERERVSGFLN